MPDASVERMLLAVASGIGMGLLPDSVPERYAAVGIRFVALRGETPAFATAVMTRRETQHTLTAAFLREVVRTQKLHTAVGSDAPVSAAA